MVNQTTKATGAPVTSTGIGLHWQKIIIDLLVELPVSAQAAIGGVIDRDGVGWPSASRLGRLCWVEERRTRSDKED